MRATPRRVGGGLVRGAVSDRAGDLRHLGRAAAGHNLNVVTIVAVDKAGNASAPSNAITVHTNWGSGC